MLTGKPKNVDEYIAAFPEETQQKLWSLRAAIQKAAPEAQEVISYSMPAYKLRGIVVYFAGYTNHISIYPAPRTAAIFKEELAGYKGGKGTVQFPMDKPIPLDLVTRIVQFRVKMNLEKKR